MKFRAIVLTVAALALGAGTAQAHPRVLARDPAVPAPVAASRHDLAVRGAVTNAALRKAERWWRAVPCQPTVQYLDLPAATAWGTAAAMAACIVYVDATGYTLGMFRGMWRPVDGTMDKIDWQVYCASIVDTVGTLLGGFPLSADYNYVRLYAFCGDWP